MYKTGDKQKVENYGGISLLNACNKLHRKILNKKLKTQAETLLLECQSKIRKGRASIDPLFSVEYL
jgi:hypothetical protein